MTFNDTGATGRSRGETSGNGGLSPEAGAGVPREPGLDARSLADLAAQDALELSRTPDAATMPLTADGGDGWSRTEASGPVPRPSTVAPGALEAVKDQGSSPEIQSPVTPRLFGQTMVRGAAMGQPETADDSKSGSGSGEEVLRTGTFTPDQGPTDVLPVSEDTGTGDRGTTNRLLGSDLTPRGATSPVPADRLTDSGGSDTTDRLLKVGVAVSRYGRDDVAGPDTGNDTDPPSHGDGHSAGHRTSNVSERNGGNEPDHHPEQVPTGNVLPTLETETRTDQEPASGSGDTGRSDGGRGNSGGSSGGDGGNDSGHGLPPGGGDEEGGDGERGAPEDGEQQPGEGGDGERGARGGEGEVSIADTAAQAPHPILSGSSGDILTRILSQPVPPEAARRYQDPHGRIGGAIERAWSTGVVMARDIREPFANPRYINSGDRNDYQDSSQPDGGKAAFTAAMHIEFEGRARESTYWDGFERLVSEVTDPSDFTKLVDVYGYLQQNTRGTTDRVRPSRVIQRVIERTAELVGDPEDGSASPTDIADAVTPAITHLLEQQRRFATAAGVEPSQINWRTNGAFSQALLTGAHAGTAERVAALRVRERLHELGYSSFGGTTSAAVRRNYSDSERYLTEATLDKIKQAIRRVYDEMPTGIGAQRTMQAVVFEAVHEAAQYNAIARQLLGAFERMRVGRSYGGALDTRGIPLTAVVQIANALTPQLNEREGLTGDRELPLLDPRSLTEIPAAFQRILYAIDPALLDDAVAGLVTEESSVHRLRMLYVEALSGQWQDFTRSPGPTVGDYVLRMKASGWKGETISRHLQQLEVGRADPKTGVLRKIAKDSRTDRSNVIMERHRPGWGTIS